MDKLPGNRLKPADFFIEMCTGACDLDEIAWAEDVIWFPLTSLASHRFLGWAGLEEFTLISPVLNPCCFFLSYPHLGSHKTAFCFNDYPSNRR